MTTKTTFPIIGTEHGETIRRNAETGVEIRGTRMDNGKSEYTVYAPGRDKMRLINYYETLAGAREEANDRAQEIRDLRDAAYSDAITENAERALAEHCPELLAAYAEALDEDAHREGLAICASIPAEGRPAAVTELLTAAELLTDEHEHLAAVRAALKLHDELRTPQGRRVTLGGL